MSKLKSAFALVLAPVILAGCAQGGAPMEDMWKCALAGAVVGGAGGAAAGSSETETAIYGGLFGAATGAVIGGALCAPGGEEAVADSDGDGVPDDVDACPGTPSGVAVDSRGCPLDSDGDGVPDYLDKCPGTASGVRVDSTGCPVQEVAPPPPPVVDSDGDGVPDDQDTCPNTPAGVAVDANGCPEVGGRLITLENVLFDFNKATIKPEFAGLLDGVAATLQSNSGMAVQVVGNTDSVGSASYNQGLSERRANAVREYLIGRGIDGSRMSTRGDGESNPVASNDSDEGRALNRRVDFLVTSK